MKRMHVTFGAAALAACLTVSACSSKSSPSSSGERDKVAGCPTANPDAGKADADRSAILHYGDAPASSLDPIRQVEGSEITVLHTIYDALVKLDDTGKPVPELATSWKMIDDDTMEFKLRGGVKFQDGTAFDADAVKFNIERAKTDDTSTIKSLLATVQKVRVVDPLTVQFDLQPPNPGALPITLAGRAGMMVSPTAVKKTGSSEAYNAHPVGAGPYRVDGDWHPVESIKVRTWDGYWNADNRLLGGIDFKRLSFDASVGALKSGDLDLQIVDTGEVATLCGDDGMRVTISPTNELRMFVMNMAWAPFDNLKVRQAIAYALDRKTLASVMTNGLAEPAYQWFREGQLPYDKSLDSQYNYDPEKAKKLLTEAGYTDTEKLSFRSEIGTGVATYQRMGEIIQSELAKVGIEMDLQLVDRNAMVGRLYGVGGAEIKVGSSPLAVAAVDQPSERFIKYLYADGTLNPSKKELSGLKELVEEADGTEDEQKRAELFQKAAKLVNDELAGGIPLYFVPGVTAYADYVGGVKVGATRADLKFDGVYITKGKKPISDRK
ncbi:ABC transporter substrate-binding protein [Sphaerimonospora thailandensis]|uniref:ABC transporter substrate-binding protein n=1 Tax=Sphaerimonospora thailandensis TaxID=795644 RepID=A0A8J3RHG7_9ACTN|nr:ABC transporter substrate-binding protein [Sphaerimonospora thailandensis]GIH72403.1 ABC transporter substrate-binding protein [Sphaerimonospora thailandensis]